MSSRHAADVLAAGEPRPGLTARVHRRNRIPRLKTQAARYNCGFDTEAR